MKLTTENIDIAVEKRDSGMSYRVIAQEVFGVTRRTEYGWRQQGKLDFENNVSSNYSVYYLKMAIADMLNRLTKKEMDELSNLLSENS